MILPSTGTINQKLIRLYSQNNDQIQFKIKNNAREVIDDLLGAAYAAYHAASFLSTMSKSFGTTAAILIETILGAMLGLIVGFIVNEINLMQPDKYADAVEHVAYGAIVGILICTFLNWWCGIILDIILGAAFGRVDYARELIPKKS